MRHSLVATLFVLLGCGANAGVATTEVEKTSEELRDGYTLVRYVATQPSFRDRESSSVVTQQVHVAIPDDVALDAPVLFRFGQESPIEEEALPDYLAYGDGRAIVVQVEHRGYGDSLSDDADQSVPTYVSRREALNDAHGVLTELQQMYTGPWFIYGLSYGGGAVIEYAARFPEDIAGVMSSSGVIDWRLANSPYDAFTQARLGEEAYAQLAGHMRNLEPVELFDQNWLDREFLEGTTSGFTQRASLQSTLGAFKTLLTGDTDSLITSLRDLDQAITGGEGAAYANDRALRTLSREDALTRKPSWRVWFWQQCTETGVFFASLESSGAWQRTEDDWTNECRALFDVELAEPPSQREFVTAVEEAGLPMVFVSGGNDAWLPLGLQPPLENDAIAVQDRWSVYETTFGLHFHVPDGFHSPDGSDPELAQAAFAALLELAAKVE